MPDETLWLRDARRPTFPVLSGDLTTDVVVVGAGITGLTAALLLEREGRRVVVLDRSEVAGGTSGRSTAHAATYLDAGYAHVEKSFGRDTARRLAGGMLQAVDRIGELVEELEIECGFQRLPGWYYARAPGGRPEVEAERAAADRAGLPIGPMSRPPLPFMSAEGFTFRDQARLDPVRYLDALAGALGSDGGAVYVRTPVTSIEGVRAPRVVTPRGTIQCQEVVLATHSPMGRHAVHTALVPRRSHVLAVRVEEALPDALFWDDADPYHYLRRARGDDDTLVLVGGADFAVGHGDAERSYQLLEAWVAERFPGSRVEARWTSQFYDSADRLPYVGRNRTGKPWIATGFGGDGITLGTLAGMVLADLVVGRSNPLAQDLRTLRVDRSAAGPFLKHNVEVARHLARHVLPGSGQDLDDLTRATGVVTRAGLRNRAAWRGEDGRLWTFDATCPHMGCVVTWNAAERSFDCPCHGSRYDTAGQIVEGPTTRALKPADQGEEARRQPSEPAPPPPGK